MTRKANQPFVRNAWYIAAWSEEIESGLLARTIMNQPIVIYRDADGNVGALEDRCCHRGAPLTHGSVTDVGLQCGYHGLTFDTKGNCVDIPGQKNIPAQAQVRHFPLVERHQILWIWMGDPALADESQIVDYSFHDDTEKWPHRKAMFQIKSNYMLMIDNLMDLTHLGFVHGRTIGGNPLQHVGADMDSHKTEKGAYFIRWMLEHDPLPNLPKGGKFPGKVDRWQEFEYVGPSVVLRSGAVSVGKALNSIASRMAFTCAYSMRQRRKLKPHSTIFGPLQMAIVKTIPRLHRKCTTKSILRLSRIRS